MNSIAGMTWSAGMPLSTLIFLYCCSANGVDVCADCAGAGGAWARAATIAIAIESMATSDVANILFPANGIGERLPGNFWRTGVYQKLDVRSLSRGNLAACARGPHPKA